MTKGLNPNFLKSKFSRVGLILAGGLAIAGCTDKPVEAQPEVKQFVQGCAPYPVYSQNRFEPYGTSVRTKPDVLSPKSKVTFFAPNEVIAVDGWTETGPIVFPDNPEPIRTNKWFHLANSDEYVSFAGVRGAPTSNYDPNSTSTDLGKLADLKPECKYKIDIPPSPK